MLSKANMPLFLSMLAKIITDVTCSGWSKQLVIIFIKISAPLYLYNVLRTSPLMYLPTQYFSNNCICPECKNLIANDTPCLSFQTCSLRFGSWTYDISRLNPFFLKEIAAVAVEGYVPSSEWAIIDNMAIKNVVKYPCCENSYADLSFHLKLKRRVTFHMRLILIPTVLLSIMSVAVFWIPPNRPDRTSLGESHTVQRGHRNAKRGSVRQCIHVSVRPSVRGFRTPSGKLINQLTSNLVCIICGFVCRNYLNLGLVGLTAVLLWPRNG